MLMPKKYPICKVNFDENAPNFTVVLSRCVKQCTFICLSLLWLTLLHNIRVSIHVCTSIDRRKSTTTNHTDLKCNQACNTTWITHPSVFQLMATCWPVSVGLLCQLIFKKSILFTYYKLLFQLPVHKTSTHDFNACQEGSLHLMHSKIWQSMQDIFFTCYSKTSSITNLKNLFPDFCSICYFLLSKKKDS